MNRLEQKIFDAVCKATTVSELNENKAKDIARIAAKIALELAEEAHGRGYWLGEHNDDGIEGWEDFNEFKEEVTGKRSSV